MQSSASPALTQSTNSYNGWAVDGEFSVYVGNLDPDTSLQDAEELLYELFLQVGTHGGKHQHSCRAVCLHVWGV